MIQRIITIILLTLSFNTSAQSISYDEAHKLCAKPAAKLHGMKGVLLDGNKYKEKIETFRKRLDNSIFQQKIPSEKEVFDALQLLKGLENLQQIVADSEIDLCLKSTHYGNYQFAWFIAKNKDNTTVLDISNEYIAITKSFINLADKSIYEKVNSKMNMPIFTADEVEKYSQFFPSLVTFRSTFGALEETISSIEPPKYNSVLTTQKIDSVLKREGNKVVSNLELFNKFHNWASLQDTQDKTIGTCEVQRKHREFCNNLVSASKTYLLWASAMTGLTIKNLKDSGNIEQVIDKRKSLIKAEKNKRNKEIIATEKKKNNAAKKTATDTASKAPTYLQPKTATKDMQPSPTFTKYGYTSNEALKKAATPQITPQATTQNTGSSFSITYLILIILAVIGTIIYYLINKPKNKQVESTTPPKNEQLQDEEPAKNTNNNWLWVVGLIVLAVIVASNDGGNSSSSNIEDLNSVALIACENRLKRGLHDPDSFKRSGNGVLLRDGFHVEETGNKKYTITVAKMFSATNGFGARVQNSYGCEVKIDVIADTWTLTQFVIN